MSQFFFKITLISNPRTVKMKSHFPQMITNQEILTLSLLFCARLILCRGQMANSLFPHSFLTILTVHSTVSVLAFFLHGILRFVSEKEKGFVTVCT